MWLLLLLLLLLLATPSENLTFKGHVDIKIIMEWPCAAKPLKYIHMYHIALFYQLFRKIYLTFNHAGLFPLLFKWWGFHFFLCSSLTFLLSWKRKKPWLHVNFVIIKTARQGKRSFEQSLLLFKSWSHSVFL